jgi:hypothetical protein
MVRWCSPGTRQAVSSGQAVLAAEAPPRPRPARVVAAAALGHVVEQGGDVEQPGLVPLAASCEQNGYSWACSG